MSRASTPGAQVPDQRVCLLGIRHHGPGSARSLVRALDDLDPDLVLVELPGDAETALDWVDHPDLVPPVALLAHVRGAPRRAAFSPLAAYSPEWLALRWARERSRPVRCIDEPAAVSLAGNDDAPPPLARRDPIGELAAAAGESDAERWWDDVVEHRGEGSPAFEAVGEAMDALREGWSPPPGEARREAFMRQHLRRALADGFERVAVVVGAWHVPALRAPLPTASSDAALVRGLARVKADVTWVPWTSRRLAAATGYGAGVTSPAWYAHVFEHPGPDGVARWFVAAGRLLRERGLPASPDHLIAGTRLADGLAALRGRPHPGLDEVLDAARAALGEGGTRALDLILDELVVGHDLGSVPDDVPLVPLARDLALEQKRVRLRPVAGRKEVELDLRTPTGLGRSQLLHRLAALGFGWAARIDDRGSSGTFRETWRLRWEPELSVQIVELSVHGTTVATAASACLVERAGRAIDLSELVQALDRALLAELPDAVEPCVQSLQARAARSSDTGELMDVLGPLSRALRYGNVRQTDVASLRAVIDALAERVVAEVADAAVLLDDTAAGLMADRLTTVQAALALIDHPTRARRWPEALLRLVHVPVAAGHLHGLVRGRACRLLHDAGHLAPPDVARVLGQALGSGAEPAMSAAFVEGFLAGSGTVLLHDADLLAVLDGWLASLGADTFGTVVPLLRRTFGAFEPAERRQLGTLVATGEPPATTAFADGDLDERRAQLALATVRQMMGLAR